MALRSSHSMVLAHVLAFLLAFASAQYAITDMLADSGTVKSKASETADTPTGPQQSAVQGNDGIGSEPVVASTGNAMTALLSGIAGPMGGLKSPSVSKTDDPLSGQALGQESIAVVSGMIEKFTHKVHLQPHEKACLERNVAQLTGDVMGTVGDAVTAIKALIAGQGTIAKGSSGNVISAGMDSAMKIISLITLSTQFLRTCVHGDALVFLNTTAQHLINGTYLEHTMLVNGVDIAHSLADSIVAFEDHHFHRFGSDIGLALRKILLSNNNKVTTLPEGIPEEEIIQKATDGLFRGFFTRGAAVEITDTAHPDVDIAVDLHACIAGNSAFFKQLWLAAWNLIAQLSVNAQQHDLFRGFDSLMQPREGQPKWAGELMTAMMQFPMALSRCGVSSNVQTMLMEAINSLNDVKIQFQFPKDRFRTEDATDKMAKAVEAWTKWDFEDFGYELGELFRELIMLALPQKYSIDSSGRLQRYTRTGAVKMSHSLPASTVVIGGAATSALFTLAVVRTGRLQRTFTADHSVPEPLIADVEDGAPELVE